MKEDVLVVRREVLFCGREPAGFVPVGEGLSFLRAARRHAFFAPRASVEEEPSLKQIIPYCVLRCGGDVLVVVRSRAQSEARLHGLASIGIGGHITPADGDPGDFDRLLLAGLLRELREEVHLQPPWRATLCGFLNDDSNPVGSVHFGFVYRVDCLELPKIAETDKMKGGPIPVERLLPPDDAGWESWSEILVGASSFWLEAQPLAEAEPFLLIRP